jgi:uncharacterized coiled-coil DUF342 family protein
LSIEMLTELEKKVTMLISLVQTLKTEKKQSVADSDQLKKELDLLKESCDDRQKKIDAAAQKIQGLLSKLETVEM